MLQNFLKRSFSYNYDLAIIGGGPGGYVAAIKAAQLGQKTVCIEKRSTLGGTCLNVGCIPAKSLLNSSHKYYEAKNHFKSYGINFSDVQPDLKQMVAMKNKSITGLTTGIKGLFKKYKVDHINAYASFKDPHTINIEKDTITAKNIILATGSEPTRLPGGILPIDEQRVLSSTGAMELQNIPEKMVVIGAGVIGLELGSVYARLGTDVTIVEFQPRIAGSADLEAAKSLQKVLVK